MTCVTIFPAGHAFRMSQTLPAHLSPQTLLWHTLVCEWLLFSRGTEMVSIPVGRLKKKQNKNPRWSLRHKNRTNWNLDIYFKNVFPVSHGLSVWPGACRSNLLERMWTCGRMRHKRGSLFWLRQMPFPFTTIQPLSYSKPSGPTGQSWTCMKSRVKSKQVEWKKGEERKRLEKKDER